jgi:hypothetical protein
MINSIDPPQKVVNFEHAVSVVEGEFVKEPGKPMLTTSNNSDSDIDAVRLGLSELCRLYHIRMHVEATIQKPQKRG